MPPAAIRTVLRLGTTSPPDVTVLTAPLSGGAVYAEVLIQSAAGATFPTKDVGRAKYEDLIVTLGDSASAPFLAWLATAWQASPPQRSGAVLTVDGQTIRSQTSFGPALISEASFPALGGANPRTDVQLRIVPTVTDTTSCSGSLTFNTTQKLWRSVNFRLELTGLDTTGVIRIEAFTVRRKVDFVTSGSGPVSLVARHLDIPNLTVTLAAARAAAWRSWHRSVVIEGNHGAGAERDGALVFLSSDLTTELSRIQLRKVGIFRFAPTDDLSRSVAHLYCEQMALILPAAMA